MATTEQFLSGTGATPLGFTTEYVRESDIKVRVNGGNELTFTTSATPTTGQYYIPINGNTIKFGDSYDSNDEIHVYRETNFDNNLVSFTPGSSIKAADLNLMHKGARFGSQEARQQIMTPDLRDGQVTSDKIKDGTIVDADISGSAAIAQTKIATGLLPSGITVNSANIVNGSIINEDVSPSANIQGSKLADDSVAMTKLGSGALPTDITVSGDNVVNRSIKEEDIEVGTLDNRYYTETELDAGQLDNRYYTEDELRINGAIDSRYYTEAELDAGQLDNRYFTEGELSGGALDTRYYNESELDAGQLDNRYFTETELNGGQLNDQYFQESELTGGALDGRYYTETELDAGQLDNRYYTETELDAGQLDNRYYTETEAEALFLRQDSSETIASGDTWSGTDAKVATTAAIDARIINVVDDVGGFVPIATEENFPTDNPDINTANDKKGGTIVSVKAASTALTAQSGTTLTIANGRGTGLAVIITGVSVTIPLGFGFLVETTPTDHTYAFHRLVPKATEVNTVASNITQVVACGDNLLDIENFADLYQISTTAPTQRADGGNLTIGDLWFDSSANQVMMVYDASAGDGFSPITPSQSTITAINSVSGHVTYLEDLGLITEGVNTGSGNNSINTVGANIAAVNTVAADLNEATSEIDTVANAITNVDIVGNAITNVNHVGTNISNVNDVANNETNINAVKANKTNIDAAVANETNINTVSASINAVNRYADEYLIQSGTPSGPSAGDLWYNSTANNLNYYTGGTWVAISPGIAGLINDANPALANHLDCNDKNLTEVGTVSGNNLQIDFGTL